MKIFVALLSVAIAAGLSGCSKNNPTSSTQNPPPENTDLSVAIDSIKNNSSGFVNVFYRITFISNKGKTCTITTQANLQYPLKSGYRQTIYLFSSSQTFVDGQIYVHDVWLDGGNGNYVLSVPASWDGWSGVKTATKVWP